MRASTERERLTVMLISMVVTRLLLHLFASKPARIDGVQAVHNDNCPSHPEGHERTAADKLYGPRYGMNNPRMN